MTGTTAFLNLVNGRTGHFLLESGHHGALWLDLDGLFSDSRRIAPFVDALAAKIAPFDVAVVCGPLLGGAFLAQLIARALGVDFCFTERVSPSGEAGLFAARYVMPAALVPRVGGRRVAIVDDVMSAGSALRATFSELRAHGAEPVVAGALLVLGTSGADYFAAQGIPVEAVAGDAYDLWLPESCPLCASGEPVERPS